MEDCKTCGGSGVIDIGDCEDGVWDTCPACDGEGIVDYEAEEFIPARDAWRAGD